MVTVSRDEIRTLDLKRDELVRNDLGRMEIKRENRKTSVDMEKVKIGRREDVTNNKRDDQVKNRNLDGLKTDQNRKDVKEVVDKVFEKNRTDTNRNSDNNENRKSNNLEVNKRETGNTSKTIKNDREKLRTIPGRKVRLKIRRELVTNETAELNKNSQEQNTQVKRQNTKVTSNDQVKRNEVKEQSRNENQNNKTIETRVNKDRTMKKDNSRERSKR